MLIIYDPFDLAELQVQTNLERGTPTSFFASFVSTKRMTTLKKLKLLIKISQTSVDRTKRDWREIKIDWTMTNNLLIEETSTN
jgi:hypothetical protein